MSIVWIAADRLNELTEWCRNKPDEAARRIMAGEGSDALAGGGPGRGADLIKRQSPVFEPPGAGRHVWVELVGSPYNGELVVVAEMERVFSLDGHCFIIALKPTSRHGLPKYAQFIGKTVKVKGESGTQVFFEEA